MGRKFKIGKMFKHSNKSISHAFKNTGHFVEKNVGNVYSDVKTGVSYTGKHLIKDADKISNTMSNPVIWIVGAVVGVVILTKK